GAFMQMYKPDEHSRHFIAHIDAVTDAKTGKTRKMANNSRPVLCFVFGIEDAQPAREQGRSMAECHYGPSQAHEFLFAQGWDKYHDRFFTRCYVQEGEDAYEEVVKARQKPSHPASTSCFRSNPDLFAIMRTLTLPRRETKHHFTCRDDGDEDCFDRGFVGHQRTGYSC